MQIWPKRFSRPSTEPILFHRIEVVVAPPALYLLLVREHLGKSIEVAAQNVFDKPNGAFTGEISAEQLKDSGIKWALVGHSERRVILGEDDGVSLNKVFADNLAQDVNQKKTAGVERGSLSANQYRKLTRPFWSSSLLARQKLQLMEDSVSFSALGKRLRYALLLDDEQPP